jgi:hypothetical protein
MKKLNLPPNFSLSGPFFTFSSPYGTWTTCHRDEYYLTRHLTPEQLKSATDFQKITKSICLGKIVSSHKHKPRKYCIDQLYPYVVLPSLQKAVDYLIQNEGKLVFCT